MAELSDKVRDAFLEARRRVKKLMENEAGNVLESDPLDDRTRESPRDYLPIHVVVPYNLIAEAYRQGFELSFYDIEIDWDTGEVTRLDDGSTKEVYIPTWEDHVPLLGGITMDPRTPNATVPIGYVGHHLRTKLVETGQIASYVALPVVLSMLQGKISL